MRRPVALLAVVLALAATTAGAQEGGPTERRLENEHLRMWVRPRTPDQVAGFYEARGFPPSAVDAIRAACFLTIRIENTSRDVLWLELDDWRLSPEDEAPSRLDRRHWRATWQGLDMSPGHRATFGWTLLPELRDLRPDEPVGGNLVLTRPDGIGEITFSLVATFATGPDRSGEAVRVRVPDLACAEDASR